MVVIVYAFALYGCWCLIRRPLHLTTMYWREIQRRHDGNVRLWWKKGRNFPCLLCDKPIWFAVERDFSRHFRHTLGR